MIYPRDIATAGATLGAVAVIDPTPTAAALVAVPLLLVGAIVRVGEATRPKDPNR